MVEGVSKMSRKVVFILIATMFTILSAHADEGRSAQGLFTHQNGSSPDTGVGPTNQIAMLLLHSGGGGSGGSGGTGGSGGSANQSCGTGTGTITFFTRNRMSSTITASVDGAPVGTLTEYYSGTKPPCGAASDAGIVTVTVTAGSHSVGANSSNMSWPGHKISVKECGCTSVPLM
jgi:hypothetical protein